MRLVAANDGERVDNGEGGELEVALLDTLQKLGSSHLSGVDGSAGSVENLEIALDGSDASNGVENRASNWADNGTSSVNDVTDGTDSTVGNTIDNVALDGSDTSNGVKDWASNRGDDRAGSVDNITNSTNGAAGNAIDTEVTLDGSDASNGVEDWASNRADNGTSSVDNVTNSAANNTSSTKVTLSGREDLDELGLHGDEVGVHGAEVNVASDAGQSLTNQTLNVGQDGVNAVESAVDSGDGDSSGGGNAGDGHGGHHSTELHCCGWFGKGVTWVKRVSGVGEAKGMVAERTIAWLREGYSGKAQ